MASATVRAQALSRKSLQKSVRSDWRYASVACILGVMAPTTSKEDPDFREVLGRNVRAARARLGIGQDSTAARMRELGFGKWLRQTVGSTERGSRPVTAEEVFGLAAVLETTIARLMAPIDEDRFVKFPSGDRVAVEVVRLWAIGQLPVGAVTWVDDKPVSGTPWTGPGVRGLPGFGDPEG
jgi:transcriptional regulator with XRE-family HTH domain